MHATFWGIPKLWPSYAETKGEIEMKQIGKGRGKEKISHPWRPLLWMPLLTIVLCLVVSKMILWGRLPETSVTYAPKIIGCTIGFLGGLQGARIAPRKKFLWGILNVISYGCMLMLGNLLFYGETFSGVGEMFLWILGGGILGCLLCNTKRSKIA